MKENVKPAVVFNQDISKNLEFALVKEAAYHPSSIRSSMVSGIQWGEEVYSVNGIENNWTDTYKKWNQTIFLHTQE